ncbi:MAG TPA: ORF6N domain-containing protein [Kiritimatiellia bacterium]
MGKLSSMTIAMTPTSVPLEHFIRTIRGERVVLDSDLARIYGVPTKQLNQAFRRNRQKFPDDFAFLLTPQEVKDIRSQIVTRYAERVAAGRFAHRRVPGARHIAFTEHGAIMAANVLNSAQATQMSVFVVRAFVKMRGALTETRELARKLANLEKKLTDRLDAHESAIVDVLQQIMRLLNPPSEPIEEPPPKKIGFIVKEPRVRYVIRKEPAVHA